MESPTNMGVRTPKAEGGRLAQTHKSFTPPDKLNDHDLKNAAVIDLFCGAGGLSHGFVLEGFRVVAGVDADPDCEYPFETNNKGKFIPKRIEDVQSAELEAYFGDSKIRILAGCAPCQPFSTYYRKGERGADERWSLLRQFIRLVKETMPTIITMENVPRLLNHSIFDEFYRSLEEFGYSLSKNIVYCPDYGIPQSRKRLVVLGSLLGPIELTYPLFKAENYPKVSDFIGDMSKVPPIKAGESSESDPLHRARYLYPINQKRIAASKPGGTWRDWDQKIVAYCHKVESGQTYQSVYGRMEWDKPAPTITTQCCGFGNGRFGHPEQNRAISLREAALLQTFPLNYQFVRPNQQPSFVKTAKLIGNAVPVKLGRAIAKSIKVHLEENHA